MSAIDSTSAPQNERCSTRSILIAFALFVATAALYSSAWKNSFVNWDDSDYVYQEPRVLGGINIAGVLWAMTANVACNWHPLTLLSLQLDAQLFGSEPFGFHRTSALIHAINAALAFYTFLMLTGSHWKSLIVAALFAFHPLRVESVAWISERKDVLSGFFFFLTLITYVRYVRRPSIVRYLCVMLCMALGLCSKPMLVTTPCVLLLLDYWPLDRLQVISGSELRRFCRLILEKIPLLGLSAIISVFTITYQRAAMSQFEKLPLVSRIENFSRGCTGYLAQTCWPSSLSHLYPIPETSILKFAESLSLLLALTSFAIWQRNRRPFLLVGWLWFLGMLVPVSGFVQVGLQQRADRYTYLPQVGLFLAVVWGVAGIVQKSRWATIVSSCAIVVFLARCGDVTIEQIQVWRDSKSLWKNAYELNPKNRMAVNQLCFLALQEGNRDQALQLADISLSIEDHFNRELLFALSGVVAHHGEYEASIPMLNKALAQRSDSGIDDSELLLRRGEFLAILGRWEEAVRDYRQVVRLAPKVIPLQFCLSHALTKIGHKEEVDQVRAVALQKLPHWPEGAVKSAWKDCTAVDTSQLKRFKAVWLAEEANWITGEQRSGFLDVLAAAYAGNGQFEEAVTTVTRAIQFAEIEQKSAYIPILRSRLELYKKHQPYLEDRLSAKNHTTK